MDKDNALKRICHKDPIKITLLLGLPKGIGFSVCAYSPRHTLTNAFPLRRDHRAGSLVVQCPRRKQLDV